MEKAYHNLVYFFIGITVVIFIGFFRTYFGLFPFFRGVDAFHHFHAILLILWLILLIIQPVLIRSRKLQLHKWFGRFSYLLVPVMVASMLYAYRVQYFRLEKLGIPRSENLALLFSPFTDILPFAVFYVLAIANTRNIPAHMRYMIATALVVVGAGIVRTLLLLVKVEIQTIFQMTTVITFLLFIVFIVFDRVKGRTVVSNPMTTAFVIFLVPNALSFFVPQTSWWQGLAGAAARNLL